MTGVRQQAVTGQEADMRLDRWFKTHFPALPHGRLAKLVRTGQVRVDGHRAKTSTRLAEGQMVRIPPLKLDSAGNPPPGAPGRTPNKAGSTLTAQDRAAMWSMVLHQDDAVIVINKPPGLASQGGKGIARHLDGLLDALARDGERPRLVHRLDRDTSGALILGRTAQSARKLAAAFRSKDAQKLYEAVLVGVPNPKDGTIDASLVKSSHGRNHLADDPDDADAKRSITAYAVIDYAGKRASRVAMRPLTGRTHQLRVHAELLGTPILGDGKYGGREAFLPAPEIEARLHLHARRLCLPHPDGGMLDITAPFPDHMVRTYDYLGFDAAVPVDFPEVD